MARSTRAKPAPKEPTPEPTPSTTKPLPKATTNPPKLFVLPKNASSDACIVTLDNPATNTPSRYFFCPSKGFYEFTRIAAPRKACRSWLITSQGAKGDTTSQEAEEKDSKEEEEEEEEEETGLGSGYVTKNADLFLATPIDLLFLILPALAPKSTKEEKQHFLALDDYTDTLASSSRHWRTLLAQFPSLKALLEKKLRSVCDTVDAGDETMYRISHTKLVALLVAKAERMVRMGLPPSMEDKFIKSALDIPVMSIRREDSSLSAVPESDTSTPAAATDSQASTGADSTTTDATTPPTTTATTPDEPAAPALQTPPQIPHLLRLRTALTYLTTSYLPPALHAPITAHLSSETFTPLATHLASIASLKASAAALRSISDNISRKRAIGDEDEEKLAEREEKKRKKEDEERKKKSESLAVKRLRKVDTSGMKKMSAFFTVKPKGK